MRTFRLLPVAFVALTLAAPGRAADDPPKPKEEKAPAPGKALPETTPLEVTIEGKDPKMALDLGGRTSTEFTAFLDKAKKDGSDVPAPAKLDLKVVVKNTGDKAIQVWTSGDSVAVDLELKGKGAVMATPNLSVTADFKMPKAVEVGAGKTVELPLSSLAGGFRGIGHFWYPTAAGEYELVATFRTGVSPAPKGAASNQDGFGNVKVSSQAFKITVVEPK